MKMKTDNVFVIIRALETQKYLLQGLLSKEKNASKKTSLQHDIQGIDNILPTLHRLWGDKYKCSKCGTIKEYKPSTHRVCECGNELFDNVDKILDGSIEVKLNV